MAKAFHTGELAAGLDDVKFRVDDRPKTINDLPKELLVSIFVAVEDLRWVRHTVSLVCKEWSEIYRSQDASPLHEKLEVDFLKEALTTAQGARLRGLGPVAGASGQERALRPPVVHGSRVISWAERRADWVRTLRLEGKYSGALEDFSSEDLGRLVTVVGSSLTQLWISSSFDVQDAAPFWEALSGSVVHAGRLRSLVVTSIIADAASESDVEPLGQLAGTLEELRLMALRQDAGGAFRLGSRLTRFPESFCGLKELRSLYLIGHLRITAIPAQISSLKKLEELNLGFCNLSSLPKELGELSGLTKLDLACNRTLENAPQDEAFPAALGKLKSLRYLGLNRCSLRAVPAFVGELESLEVLDLSENDDQIYAMLDFLIEGCPRLRQLWVGKGLNTPETLAHLRAFNAKLLAKDPNAGVFSY